MAVVLTARYLKIPLTPEEKLDTLTYALDLWISGMMDACTSEDGVLQVKAWDVVNEAISGADSDGDGIYDLQHGSADTPNDFFWQDHMGDLEYVRTVVRLARQYGGNDLKLFINDYNLESDWDQNKKLKSLIKWIEKWEADGTTKIDGIGSQMHISCYMNPQTQESKKKAIEESFKLMAESGKLVRISELDMGLVDESILPTLPRSSTMPWPSSTLGSSRSTRRSSRHPSNGVSASGVPPTALQAAVGVLTSL